MKEICGFKTTDNRFFEDKLSADNHQKQLDKNDLLRRKRQYIKNALYKADNEHKNVFERLLSNYHSTGSNLTLNSQTNLEEALIWKSNIIQEIINGLKFIK